MALFRRNKIDQAGMPTEVQNYYQAQGRERALTSWLLAGATLFVTVLVVLGIFFGGRWTYRKFKGSNKPAPVAVQTENTPTESKPTTTTTKPDTPSQTSSTSTTTPSTPSQNSTSASNSNLANTGPGDTLAIFFAISVLAYVGHRLYLAKLT